MAPGKQNGGPAASPNLGSASILTAPVRPEVNHRNPRK